MEGMATLAHPTAPPPRLEDQHADGYAAAVEFHNREDDEIEEDEDGEELDPEVVADLRANEEPIECPWPIYSEEGRAWFAGWNEYCQEYDHAERRPLHNS